MTRSHRRLPILIVIFALFASAAICDLTPLQAEVERVVDQLWEEFKRAVIEEVKRVAEELLEEVERELKEIENEISSWINEAMRALEAVIAELFPPSEDTVPKEEQKTYYTIAEAPLRRCALGCEKEPVRNSSDHEIKLGPGVQVTVTGEENGDILKNSSLWYKTTYNGNAAFVHSSALTLNPPTPAKVKVGYPQLTLPWPVGKTYRVSGDYLGFKGYDGKDHKGVDFTFPDEDTDDFVVSSGSGTVLAVENGCDGQVKSCGGYFGNHVRISMGDYIIIYAHLDCSGNPEEKCLRKEAKDVERGDTLGQGGCTGNCDHHHLHFEVHFLSKKQDPKYPDDPKKQITVIESQAPIFVDCGYCGPKFPLAYTRVR